MHNNNNNNNNNNYNNNNNRELVLPINKDLNLTINNLDMVSNSKT